MKKILRKVVADYVSSTEGREELKKYFDMTTHNGWNAHQSLLAHIGNSLATEVISPEFRKLDPDERLVRLSAYSMVGEVVRFLLALPAEVNKHIALKEKAGATSVGGVTAAKNQRGATPQGEATGRR